MLTIITPTYNEAKNIENLSRKIHDSVSEMDYELLIVDDNSPDGTADIASELMDKYPIRVLVRKKNRGLSQSVCEGFRKAKGDIIGVIDADLSHPPEVIPNMINAMQKKNADIIIGSRLVKGGGTEDWPKYRKITSYIATMLAKPLTKISDPMSGFFFVKKSVLKGARLKPKGYKILLEILVKGNYSKSIEYPILFRNRTEGSSKLNIKTNIEYLLQLCNLYSYKIKNKLHLIK